MKNKIFRPCAYCRGQKQVSCPLCCSVCKVSFLAASKNRERTVYINYVNGRPSIGKSRHKLCPIVQLRLRKLNTPEQSRIIIKPPVSFEIVDGKAELRTPTIGYQESFPPMVL